MHFGLHAHFFSLDPHFGWIPRLNYTVELSRVLLNGFECVQQLRDVEERLGNAYKLIEELNEKLRNSNSSSGRGSIAQMLQKIREQLNSEFERYRCDTEESMKRTLTEMKLRLDQRLRENQRLQEERDRLEDVLAKIKGELNQIQSQVR